MTKIWCVRIEFGASAKHSVESELESRTISALRDTCLPKLISGELWVKDADRFVSGVT